MKGNRNQLSLNTISKAIIKDRQSGVWEGRGPELSDFAAVKAKLWNGFETIWEFLEVIPWTNYSSNSSSIKTEYVFHEKPTNFHDTATHDTTQNNTKAQHKGTNRWAVQWSEGKWNVDLLQHLMNLETLLKAARAGHGGLHL